MSHPPGALAKTPIASASADEKASLSVPRAVMIDVLEKRKYRAAQCRSVPASVFFYCIYIAALLTHVTIGPGYDFEQRFGRATASCLRRATSPFVAWPLSRPAAC